MNWHHLYGYLTKLLISYYSFLKYYYNETDGKMFRLNFINDSLKLKLDENKISPEVYNSYDEIRKCFIEYKYYFETTGISGFGPDKMSYYELIDFIYKVCKIIEFYYLRNMKYDILNKLRTEILYIVEREIVSIKKG